MARYGRLSRLGRFEPRGKRWVDMMENDEFGIITNHFCLATI